MTVIIVLKQGSKGPTDKISVPVSTSVTSTPSAAQVPDGKSKVEQFLASVSAGKASDAVMMMTSATTGNDANKQAMAVQFNIFSKFVVKSVEPIIQEDWTQTSQEYKVTVDVAVKPGAAAGAPIPNYGWENGTNVRFVTLEKVGSDWKIQGIATGP